MKPVLIRFEPEMLAALNALAERRGMSLALLVRTIIEERLKEKDGSKG